MDEPSDRLDLKVKLRALLRQGVSGQVCLSAIADDLRLAFPQANVWIYGFDPGLHALVLRYAHDLDQEGQQAFRLMPVGPTAWTGGMAAHYFRPISTKDMSSSNAWSTYADLVSRLGYKSCWAVPVLNVLDEVVGAVVVLYKASVQPAPDERRHVETLIPLIAYVLQCFDFDGQAMPTQPSGWPAEVKASNNAALVADATTPASSSVLTGHVPGDRVRTGFTPHLMHDHLTGLPNSQYLESRLAHENRMIEVRGRPLAVLYIDLDDFKPVNAGFGYKVGDNLLLEAVRRLQGLLAPDDTLVRISGDEFVLLCPSRDSDQSLAALADAIVQAMHQPFHAAGQWLLVSASVGVAVSDATLADAHELVQRATLAKHQAKQQGGNAWQWYGRDSDLPATISQMVMLRTDLQDALRNNHLLLHYQPIYDAVTGTLCGLEALLRWQHPERGMVPPGVFIPVIERTGQIIEIGRWVLRRVCADMAQIYGEGHLGVPIAVNISPLQFRRHGFVTELLSILDETGMPAHMLQLEVTEGMLMSSAERVIDVLRSLSDKGVRVAIDDFGTGFSSLSYLRKLPISKIKIDRSFVTDLSTEHSALAIVTSIISLAHHLGLRVVAEGVETAEQAQALQKLGCDELQGFYFARPSSLHSLLSGQ